VLGTNGLLTMIDQLAFQCPEEGLHRCVVIPTTSTVHAGLDAVLLQQHLIPLVGVLTALIRVMEEATPGRASLNGHV
jgi:hypothetical protein